MKGKKVLIINHIFWPDKINTARHITELAEELKLRSWEVSVLVGNRDYRSNDVVGEKNEDWNGIKIYRIFIPRINNNNNFGRLFTSIWLISSFIFKLPFLGDFNAIILGSNPPFSFFLIPAIKFLKRKSKIIFWSFDLYPEAIYASKGENNFKGLAVLNWLISKCYQQLDVIVDIGQCMKKLLSKYAPNVSSLTLTPWAFVENNELDAIHYPTRNLLFGNSKLTIMYTGTIGHAHEFDNFLALARKLNSLNSSVAFCFAGFGKKMEELKSQCSSSDTNITFAGFVNSDIELEERLSTADIMMVSLKDDWTGISVPSKFFTSIATGKPVLYSGLKGSAIESWISEYDLGFHLTKDNIDFMAEKLIQISEDNNLIAQIKENCLFTYNNKFSKKIVCDNWALMLESFIANP